MLWWEPQPGTFQTTLSLLGMCSLVGVGRHNGHKRATSGLRVKWAWRKLSGDGEPGIWLGCHPRKVMGGWVGPWSTGLLIAVILGTKLTFTSKWEKLPDCPSKNCCWALTSVGWNSDASKLHFGQLAVAIRGLRGWLKPGMAAYPDIACCVFYYDVASLLVKITMALMCSSPLLLHHLTWRLSCECPDLATPAEEDSGKDRCGAQLWPWPQRGLKEKVSNHWLSRGHKSKIQTPAALLITLVVHQMMTTSGTL